MIRDETQIRKVTILGLVVNLVLVLIKAVVGTLFGSIALIADAIHSLSDLATDGVVFIGVHFGAKPADENHPYGHGKIETMAALLIAGILILAGAGIGWKAGQALLHANQTSVSWMVLATAVISVLLKEWIFRRTLSVARKTHSSALKANAWHHRTDALSSLVVLIGALAMMLGWSYGDQMAGIFVGLMVAYAGLKIGLDCFNELGEGAVDKLTEDKISGIIAQQPGVDTWHQLRARRVGRNIVMDVHILVKPDLTVVQGHTIAENVEKAISEGMKRPMNITVHIEPNLPEERAQV